MYIHKDCLTYNCKSVFKLKFSSIYIIARCGGVQSPNVIGFTVAGFSLLYIVKASLQVIYGNYSTRGHCQEINAVQGKSK